MDVDVQADKQDYKEWENEEERTTKWKQATAINNEAAEHVKAMARKLQAQEEEERKINKEEEQWTTHEQDIETSIREEEYNSEEQ